MFRSGTLWILGSLSVALLGAGPATHRLWRERPPGEATIPQFVPPTSLAPLIRAVRASVVNVSSAEEEPSPTPLEHSDIALGSGVIISPDGYVLTNSHVLEGGRRIHLKLSNGRELSAQITGRDPTTDVALLKVTGNVADLPYAYLGDSDKLQVGDWVLAIGTPFGLEQSVSQGIISAKERVLGVGVFDDFLQTDALINPGNSGGPLFNMRGEVVGINTSIMSGGQGIGFAVPISMVKDLLPNLHEHGQLERGWLGVNIQEQPASPDGGRQGAVVTEVFKGSPAAAAGLKVGDRVLAVNGRPADSYLQLLRRISILAPGTQVKLSILRNARAREVTAKLGARPAPNAPVAEAGSSRAEKLGLVLRELSDSVASALKLQPFSAVLVAGVVPGSPAERAGIQAGDLIEEVNRRRVRDVQSLKETLEELEANRDVLLRLKRSDSSRYVAVKPNPAP